jgi:SAM-dependent methyltransferase
MPIRGKLYDETFGSFFNYCELAKLIVYDIGLRAPLNFNFIDLACGTGCLLEALQQYLPSNRLYGIDIDDSQLCLAKEKAPSVRFFKFNINELPMAGESISWSHGIVHLGFCYLNTLSIEEREKLLCVIKRTKGVNQILFEIQNDHYQSVRYSEGEWYENLLSSGVTLRSKWIYNDSHHKSKKLLLHFHGNGFNNKDEVEIFPWPIYDCIRTLESIGWTLIEVLPAKYRQYDGHVPSHWIVRCQKQLVTENYFNQMENQGK